MSILKIVNKTDGYYSRIESFFGLAAYLLRPEKTSPGLVYGNGIYINSSEEVAKQFKNIYQAYGSSGICLHHFIVGFDTQGSEGYMTEPMALETAGFAMSLAGLDIYQHIEAVHTDTENIHVHIMLNATSYVTGYKYPNNQISQREPAEQICFCQTVKRRNMGEIIRKPVGYFGEEPERLYTQLPICHLIYGNSDEIG